jgi:hypothetical protein
VTSPLLKLFFFKKYPSILKFPPFFPLFLTAIPRNKPQQSAAAALKRQQSRLTSLDKGGNQ